MRFPDPPRGLKAIPWRMPILIYRLGLGSLIGSRALLLSHIGRKSGKTRQIVLEIIHKSQEGHTYTVVSGFGTESHWFQNNTHNPNVNIQIGGKKFEAIAQQLEPDQAELVFLDYVNKYPQGFRSLAKLVGYDIEHTIEGYREFGRQIPMIQFTADKPIN